MFIEIAAVIVTLYILIIVFVIGLCKAAAAGTTVSEKRYAELLERDERDRQAQNK